MLVLASVLYYNHSYNVSPKQDNIIILEANLNPCLLADISRLKLDISHGFKARKCDYSKIMSLALSQYFKYEHAWAIAPEFSLTNNYHPDSLVSRINLNLGINYGISTNRLSCELKNRVAVSWWVLMKDQLWNLANAAMSDEGRFWAVAQIGFEICFFRFNINRYPSSSGNYINFSVLNMNNFNTSDLDELDIKYELETTHGVEDIRVIKWRWDDVDQHRYITQMFGYVNSNAA